MKKILIVVLGLIIMAVVCSAEEAAIQQTIPEGWWANAYPTYIPVGFNTAHEAVYDEECVLAYTRKTDEAHDDYLNVTFYRKDIWYLNDKYKNMEQKEITINSHRATIYLESEVGRYIIWKTDELVVKVYGVGLSVEEVIEVAEGIESINEEKPEIGVTVAGELGFEYANGKEHVLDAGEGYYICWRDDLDSIYLYEAEAGWNAVALDGYISGFANGFIKAYYSEEDLIYNYELIDTESEFGDMYTKLLDGELGWQDYGYLFTPISAEYEDGNVFVRLDKCDYTMRISLEDNAANIYRLDKYSDIRFENATTEMKLRLGTGYVSDKGILLSVGDGYWVFWAFDKGVWVNNINDDYVSRNTLGWRQVEIDDSEYNIDISSESFGPYYAIKGNGYLYISCAESKAIIVDLEDYSGKLTHNNYIADNGGGLYEKIGSMNVNEVKVIYADSISEQNVNLKFDVIDGESVKSINNIYADGNEYVIVYCVQDDDDETKFGTKTYIAWVDNVGNVHAKEFLYYGYPNRMIDCIYNKATDTFVGYYDREDDSKRDISHDALIISNKNSGTRIIYAYYEYSDEWQIDQMFIVKPSDIVYDYDKELIKGLKGYDIIYNEEDYVDEETWIKYKAGPQAMDWAFEPVCVFDDNVALLVGQSKKGFEKVLLMDLYTYDMVEIDTYEDIYYDLELISGTYYNNGTYISTLYDEEFLSGFNYRNCIVRIEGR